MVIFSTRGRALKGPPSLYSTLSDSNRMVDTHGTSGIIGRGTVIKTSLLGSGDVVVQGRFEGAVSLKDQLSIEPEGKVFADVEAENLEVHGEMSGDINASDKVLVAATAKVVGDIKALRVAIQDGARFKGSSERDVKLPEDI